MRANDGRTALMLTRDPEMTELLLQNGADVKLRSNDGLTALIAAAEHRDLFSGETASAAGQRCAGKDQKRRYGPENRHPQRGHCFGRTSAKSGGQVKI